MNPGGLTESKYPCNTCFAEPFGVHILVVNDSAWMFYVK